MSIVGRSPIESKDAEVAELAQMYFLPRKN